MIAIEHDPVNIDRPVKNLPETISIIYLVVCSVVIFAYLFSKI